MSIPWLEHEGDDWRIAKIDPYEAGDIDYVPAANRCRPGTGWVYCTHAEDSLEVCRCPCTCLDQQHCPRREAKA